MSHVLRNPPEGLPSPSFPVGLFTRILSGHPVPGVWTMVDVASKREIVVVEFPARLRIHNLWLGVVRQVLDHLRRLLAVPLAQAGFDAQLVADQIGGRTKLVNPASEIGRASCRERVYSGV